MTKAIPVTEVLDYEQIFDEDERKMLKNRMPTLEDIKTLRRIVKQIKLAVAEDSAEGYKRAAKLRDTKNKLINKKA